MYEYKYTLKKFIFSSIYLSSLNDVNCFINNITKAKLVHRLGDNYFSIYFRAKRIL